jgi:hypothetical protein
MSNGAKSGAVGLAVLFCIGWFLSGNEIWLVLLGLGVVLLYLIAHTLIYDLPDKLPMEEIEAINGRVDNIERRLDDILEELKLQLPNNLRAKRAGKSRQTTTENNSKEAELFFKINAFCTLAKVDAEDQERIPDLREAYESRKQTAIALARQMRDPIMRDPALEAIIDLCMVAKDESEAKKLFDAIEEEPFAERILSKYPQLGATF